MSTRENIRLIARSPLNLDQIVQTLKAYKSEKITSALTIIALALIFLSEMASGKRVETHLIVKRYLQPDFVLGREPTQ